MRAYQGRGNFPLVWGDGTFRYCGDAADYPSKKHTFTCLNALHECVARQRTKLLHSLNQIRQKSLGTRTSTTGRPHIRPKIGRSPAGKNTSASISPKRGQTIRYLYIKLNRTMPRMRWMAVWRQASWRRFLKIFPKCT